MCSRGNWIRCSKFDPSGNVLARELDAMLEIRSIRECVGVMTERFEQMENKRLPLALLVAFELGGERGELMESAFL
jgi:hypothetical protein